MLALCTLRKLTLIVRLLGLLNEHGSCFPMFSSVIHVCFTLIYFRIWLDVVLMVWEVVINLRCQLSITTLRAIIYSEETQICGFKGMLGLRPVLDF